ncbi:hypothetical protein [Rhodococcus sp. HS-D2]|uniref:hypothetical protein n=1 Tax=Rhodococcus sp. HS-D2 TaxID=1384636 RepID=UPI0007D9EEF9|nr:hypothetical protein [Rhodococcus sp. HS-D2]
MPETLTTARTVRIWDHDFAFLEARDLDIEYRRERTVVRLALPIVDELAQKIVEASFDGSGYGAHITIDTDGERWSGRLAEVTVCRAAGVRIAELLYVDVNNKSEFETLLEKL